MIDDPRFSTTKARMQHRNEIERLLQERLKERTASEWMEKMDETGEGTPFAPINTLDHVFQDPHVVSRDIVAEIEHPVTGKIRMVAPPVHYDGARCEVRMPPPRLGEHNGEVLSWPWDTMRLKWRNFKKRHSVTAGGTMDAQDLMRGGFLRCN